MYHSFERPVVRNGGSVQSQRKARTMRKNKTSMIMKAMTAAFALLLVSAMALVGCSSPANEQASSSSSSSMEEAVQDYGASSESAAQEGEVAVTVAIAPEGDINTGTVEEVVIPEGGTVFDALEATSATVESSDGSYGKFIESIDGLENGSAGATSGWVFMVNGQNVTVACDEFPVNDGDVIEWLFTTGE